MAIQDVRPEVWVGKINEFIKKQFASDTICTTEYEGQVNAGNETVHIPYLGDVEVETYDPVNGITPTDIDGGIIDLTLDQDDAYAKFIDSKLNFFKGDLAIVEDISAKVAESVKKRVDRYVFTTCSTSDASTTLANKTLTNPEDAYNFLVDIATLLDEVEASEMRFAVVPNFVIQLLRKDARYNTYRDILEGGKIMNVAGLDLIPSVNLVTDVNGTQVVAGVYKSIAKVAVAISATTFPHATRDGYVVRGRFIYGAKLLNSKAIATCKVKLA